jgi:NAD-dependent dihydropyrimidine dehydrogenase PreA subunit
MTDTWYPIIDYDLCISCMKCVEFCPVKVLEEKDGKPVVAYKEKCHDFLGNCGKICPVGAISYPEQGK